MEKINILWVDDEVDLLKPHIMFLEQKGFQVDTATNGDDALDYIDEKTYDIVFLDENMPGLSGLETLSRINVNHRMPVVMITKSEEERIMEEAIGSRIADYLIKPVNPNQILLSIKKNLDTKRLVSEKTTMNYQQEFREIGMDLMSVNSHQDWTEMYKRLVYWELELDKLQESGMQEVLKSQKAEANNLFFRYIQGNYIDWLNDSGERPPVMSHTLFRKWIYPEMGKEKPVFMILVDNLRYDQWKVIQPTIEQHFKVNEESSFYSILPTATQYARNSIFAGMMPLEISKRFPHMWKNDPEEGGKNLFEQDLLGEQLSRLGYKDKFSYTKITNVNSGRKLVDNVNSLMHNKFNAVVYNFVDMLSHAKTDTEVIRELVADEKSYRSLTKTWFENSPLYELIRILADKDVRLILTTDHGTINVNEPSKLVGDRDTSSNLRYKMGRNLSYKAKDVFEINRPEEAHLPKVNVSSKYVFAKEDKFFAYPNNYNYYVKYYRNTYQHGGVSLEEIICPFVVLERK